MGTDEEQEDARRDRLAQIEDTLRSLAKQAGELNEPTLAFLVVIAADEARLSRVDASGTDFTWRKQD